jgi:hypothetical protein
VILVWTVSLRPRPSGCLRRVLLCRVEMRGPVGMRHPLRRGTRTIDAIALAFGRIGACGSVSGHLVPASPTGRSHTVPATIVTKYTAVIVEGRIVLNILLSYSRLIGRPARARPIVAPEAEEAAKR